MLGNSKISLWKKSLTLIKQAKINEILHEFNKNFLKFVIELDWIVITFILLVEDFFIPDADDDVVLPILLFNNSEAVSESLFLKLFSISPLTIVLPFDNFLIHGLSWAVAIVMNKVMENSIRTIRIAVCSELK